VADYILEVRNLKKYFPTSRGPLHAVDDVSFSLERGKTLGLVGESGCGKSTTGRAILRLIEPTSGEVFFNGVDITKLSQREMRKMRKNIQIIFQDPFSSLDPKNTVSQIIAEPLRVNKILRNRLKIEERVLELMETVGLAERLINTYPHELDGGRRQRIGIARALAMDPQLIICDEPVSALDVSIQKEFVALHHPWRVRNQTQNGEGCSGFPSTGFPHKPNGLPAFQLKIKPVESVYNAIFGLVTYYKILHIQNIIIRFVFHLTTHTPCGIIIVSTWDPLHLVVHHRSSSGKVPSP
jgi:ABC-type dipeptide/oligopeptide/nickel transport system ATPase subunit